MALISPGVQVSVIDESFYTTAEPGTRPLIVVASAANKTNSSGTGTASGTLPSNAGRVYTITSQRELAETFGDPVFKIDSNNNPIHAGELNEYGLQAAYSFLGVSNSVLVVRADIDLNELNPQATAPGGEPNNGTFWLDTANSTYGIFEWNGSAATDGGQTFTNKVPTVYTELPTASAADNGKYAMLVEDNELSLYYKSPYSQTGIPSATGAWVKVGTDEWSTSHAFVTASLIPATNQVEATYSVTLDGGTPISITVAAFGNASQAVATAIQNGGGNVSARVNAGGLLEIFAEISGLTNFNITGSPEFLEDFGIEAGDYQPARLAISKHTEVPQWKRSTLAEFNDGLASGSVWIKTTEPNAGARWRVKNYNSATKLWDQVNAPLYATDAAATAGIDPTGAGANIVVNSVYVQYDINNEGSNIPVAEFLVKRRNTTTTWTALPTGTSTPIYYISATAPTTLTGNGKLWYTSVIDEVDILVNGAPGQGWKGYLNVYPSTNPGGPIVSPTRPTLQSDNTPLVDGDLWIDTSDLENYPFLRRWNDSFKRWDLVDVSDQTTENGILFADARWGLTGEDDIAAPIAVVDQETGLATIEGLNKVNFVDFDAPDPALYPQGMLLWNTRRSGFNVKKFVRDYVDLQADNNRQGGEQMEDYHPHRWVTESSNQADGSGSFGRHAQRKVIIQKLQALVNTNDEIRDTERNGFNLIAVPGYPELIGEMLTLNNDRGLTAFVVGDTPARLNPSATNLNNWGTNLAGSVQDDDNGLVSRDEYLGVFYPWGFSSDNFGRDVAVPPSHMILRMIALNDQIAYPWFAPAGTRRGNITNAGAVGYVTAEGEFQSVALNDGQRDTLYNVAVNPITFFSGAGLVNFGQKTRARNASALDRINVARLVIFLRNQLNKLAKPYIFEPNDKITRDEIKQSIESLLLELVGQRALYDYLVVCDESNNTPNRIDRNELHVDIAIEPVKAVEFIYIPVRLKNTGEIAGLG